MSKSPGSLCSRSLTEKTSGKWLAIVDSSIGALLGMYIFRHKTQHKKFTLGVPAILVAQIALIYFFLQR